MNFFVDVFPVLINFLLIIFLIVCIVLGIKLINVVDKVDKIADSVSYKVESLNSVFHIIDIANDKLAFLTDKATDAVSGLLKRLKASKKTKKEDVYYE